MRRNVLPIQVDYKQNPTPVIRRKKDFTNYDNTKHKSAVQRSSIIEETINENFVGKKIGVYSKDSFITGICEKYSSGTLFLRKSHYKFMSESVDLVVEGDSDYIAIDKMGKSIVLM